MISIDKWTTIRSLHKENHSIRSIAKMLGISKNTVKRALKSEQAPRYTRQTKEVHILQEYETTILQMIEKNLIGTRIFNELKKQGYTGSYCTVTRFIRKHRQHVEKKKTTVRYETNPGFQAQFDWSPYKVNINGQTESIYCFLLILSYSRKKHIVFSKNQKVEEVLEALEEGIRSFTGVPQQIVVDNAKQLVLSHPRDQEATYHPMFLELAGIYRFKPYACQTYWPRTKGKVERPFYYIEQHFIKGREFESFEHLCAEGEKFIREWEMELNKTTLVAPAERFKEEKDCLSPLPSTTFTHQQKETRKVNWDCLLSFRGVKYSVPHPYAGKQVWVRSSRGNELLVYNENSKVIAIHKISFQTGETIMNPSHYEGLSGELAKSLPKLREQFIRTFSNGQKYVALLQEHVKANHLHRFHNIMTLRNHYHDDSINIAIEQAILFKRTDMEFIPNILKSSSRKTISVPVVEKIPTNKPPEIRPLSYYSHLLH